MKKFVLIALATLVFAHDNASQNHTDAAAPDPIQFALQSRQFNDAVLLIDSALTTAANQRDYLLYLRGLALFYNEDYTNAIAACDQFTQAHPDSTWLNKAAFLQAQCHLKLGEFKQAEAIYSKEASRLLSPRRKSEIAQIYIDLAEAFARKPKDADLDAPPPNYQKAYELYQKVLTLEADSDLRETATFQLGRMMQLQENYTQAVVDYEAYLTQFDPDYQQRVDAEQRPQKRKSQGNYRYQARYHLAECRIAMNRHLLARLTLEDLLRLFDIEMEGLLPFIKDARFLLTRTYHFPTPLSDEELELGIQAARRFQAQFPRDSRSMALASEIAEAYRTRGRSEEALAAYQDVLEKKGFKVNEKKRHLPILNTHDYHHLRMFAVFQIGSILSGQRKYTKAIEAWTRYIREFPNGSHWTEAQQGIADDEFRIGMTYLAEENYDQAVKAFDAFQAKHPLDERVRKIMFIYGQLHAHKGEHGLAIAEWEKLVRKFPNTDESSSALLRIGQTYELRLGDFEKALKSYRKLTSGTWAAHAQREAQELIRQMTEKHLQLVTPRTFRTNEPAHVRASLRNIEAVTVKLYKIDLEAYWRKMYGVDGIEGLDLALIEPDRTWEYCVPKYRKYKNFECDIDIPFEGPGVYAVHLGDESLESTTLLIRSDIETIAKTSRREALIFVQDVVKAEVVADARVLVSDGSNVVFEGVTGKDGVLHATEPAISNYSLQENQLNDTRWVMAFVSKEGHVATDGIDVSGLGFSKGLTPRGYIYTDRPAYRPGEYVSIRAIIRDVRDGVYVVPDAVHHLSVIDARGRQIYKEEVKLSQFGGFHTQMQLDEGASVGEYRIRVARYDAGRKLEIASHIFTGNFQVQRFQLEKVQLLLDFPRRVYFRGEQVEAAFTARYYYGQPVKNAQIQYKLPDGRSYTETTDNQGKLKVDFDTKSMQPGKLLHFSGTVAGENASVRAAVTLAHLGFTISTKPDAKLVISGEPFNVTFQTKGADGQPIGAKLTVKVIQRQWSHSVSPVLSKLPWSISYDFSRSTEVIFQEHNLQTDAQTGIGTIQLALDKGGGYYIRASGTDQFGQIVVGSRRVFISDEDDRTQLLIFAERTKTKVGASETIRVHSRLKPVLALISFEGETIIDYDVVLLKPGMNPMRVVVGHEHFPNFYLAVAAIDNRRLRTHRKHFTVERQLNLDVSWKRSDSESEDNSLIPSYTPGEVAEIQVRATNQLGQPVKADFSLALVDEALFTVYKDASMDINDFFQKGLRREAAMRTASSCTFYYTAVTGSVNVEIQAESRKRRGGRPLRAGSQALRAQAPRLEEPLDEPKVREESTYAGHWIGSVITDDSGLATVHIPMPEKTTKWRLTGRGSTVDTLVGQVSVNAITRKDFFLDVRTPRIVTEGDKIRVAVRLHNLTGYEGDAEVKLSLSVDESQPAHGDHKQITISAHDTSEIIFDGFTIPAGKLHASSNQSQLTVEVTATAGSLRDGIRRKITIRPWGLEFMDAQSGTATGDASVYVELPSDQRYTRKGLTISIGPTVSRIVYDLALNDLPRPFQSGSITRPVIIPSDSGGDLLAVAYALRYQQAVGDNPMDNRRLLTRARTLVNRLVTAQNEDGGWSLIRGVTESYPRVTARNLWALATTRDGGAAVDDQVFANAENYLKEALVQINQSDNDTRAVILHAISTVGTVDFDDANRFYRRRNQLSDTALVHAALVFVNLNRLVIAGELLDILERRSLLPEQQGNAKNSSSIAARGPVETVALALLGMQAARPNSTWVKDAVEYLIGQRRYYGYSPYAAKGAVVAALATYYQTTQYAADDYRLSLLVNGEPLETTVVQADSANRLIHVPTVQILDGRNRVEMRIDGRGTYTYLVTINGFSPVIPSWVGTNSKTDESLKNVEITRRYLHPPLQYQGKPIVAQSTTEMTRLEAGAKVQVAVDIVHEQSAVTPDLGEDDRYLVVDEFFPAGTIVVDGSVVGEFQQYELGDGVIRFYTRRGAPLTGYSYQLVSYAPGEFRVLPTVIRDPEHPGDMRLGPVALLSVLAPGEKSSTSYEMNSAEYYALGKAYFDDGQYDEARPMLEALPTASPHYNAKETAQMLLWIYTTEDDYGAKNVVDAFERTRDRYPELYIPFDKIQVVSSAYRDIGEFERAMSVHRSTIESSFANDVGVSAAIQDEGEFLRSLDYIEGLWREYPDTATTIPAYFAIAQSLYASVDREVKRVNDAKSETMSKSENLNRTVRMLSQFLTLYPTNPLADDAAFSLANALLDVEDFRSVVQLCQMIQANHSDSNLLSSFQYVEALGLFALNDYDNAIAAAARVASGESEDRDFARYIIGQIYHAQDKPQKAIQWYSKVRKIYPDADESIAHFEAQQIAFPEVTVKRPEPNADVVLDFKLRNISSAVIEVYRINLMNLFLREKDLGRIANVHLAGIEPDFSQTVEFGDEDGFREVSGGFPLPITDEGAYLVTCRGGNLFTSGLVLITPLKIEVQEGAESGRVRVIVRDTVSAKYQSKVHVKVASSENEHLISGETDLRGIFIADGLHGKTTVIARDGLNRYAFHRGDVWLGPQSSESETTPSPRAATDYRQHLNHKNQEIQSSNLETLDRLRRDSRTGVALQRTF